MASKISTVSAINTTVASTLGTGILYMPSAFHSLGYTYAFLVIAFVGFITYFSLYSLSYAAKSTETGNEESSYPGLAAKFSRFLSLLVDFMLFGSNYGCAIFFTRLFAEYSSFILKNTLNVSADQEIMRKCLVVFIVLVSMYFFTKRSLSSLDFISKISMAAATFYTCLNIFYGIVYGKENKELLSTGTNISGGIVKFVFALHCQFSFLSIFNEMEDKSLGNVSNVCLLSSIIGVIIYASAGYFGYKAVGPSIGSNSILEIYKNPNDPFLKYIKENTFDKGAYLPQSVAFLFLFIFFGAIVFNAFPCIPIIQSYATIKSKPVSRNFVILLLGISLLLTGLPETLFELLLDIIGAVFTNALSFIFPSIFMIYCTPSFSIKSIFSYVLILMSLALMVDSLIKMFK